MKYIFSFLASTLCTACALAQLLPVYHVTQQLTQEGFVHLTWEDAPPTGLQEDFNDGIAQDFHFWTPLSDIAPDEAYYIIEDGRVVIIADQGGARATGIYGGIRFSDFTCEIETQFVGGYNSTRGIAFRVSETGDNFAGYVFEIAHNPPYPPQYCVGSIAENGHEYFQIPWTNSDLINTEIGESNILKVVCQGEIYDIYINGVYVNTDDSQLFSNGHVGFFQGQDTESSYDYITCTYDAQLQDRSVIPQRGTPVTRWLDVDGRPTDHPPVMAEPDDARGSSATAVHPRDINPNQPRQQSLRGHQQGDQINELDEFVEYRIYRNGEFICATADTVFTDQLPGYGNYEYRVTAVYDPEGESIPSVAEIVTWNAVTYTLETVNYVVPWTGGTISYEALLFSELNQPFQNVVYRSYVTTPLGDVIGPTFQRSFTLGPQAYIHIPEVPVQVPANAPPGNYFLTGKLFYQGAPVFEQTFQFDKMGGGN